MKGVDWTDNTHLQIESSFHVGQPIGHKTDFVDIAVMGIVVNVRIGGAYNGNDDE